MKDQGHSIERTSKLFRLIDIKFKKEIMNILKELRKAINRSADYYK